MNQGYGLDKLANDKDWFIRMKLAEKGYELDKLINDENKYVRVVAEIKKYGLDKLLNDKDWLIKNKKDFKKDLSSKYDKDADDFYLCYEEEFYYDLMDALEEV